MLICDIERILSFVTYFETNLLYSLSWPWTHDFLASASGIYSVVHLYFLSWGFKELYFAVSYHQVAR